MSEKDLRYEVWKEHTRTWTNCLRCRLADARRLSDTEKGVRPTNVIPARTLKNDPREVIPRSPLYLLMPCPDLVQEYHTDVYGRTAPGEEEWPPQIRALWNVWDAIEKACGSYPYDIDDVPIGFAVGCRPMDFTDVRKRADPNQGILKACRPRWQTEIKLADPVMVIAFGHHAFASLRPTDIKKGKYSKAIGEIVPFTVPGVRGEITYTAYIAPDLYEVADNAQPIQWKKPFTKMPTHSPVREPVANLRWHVWRALWICKAVELGRQGVALPDLPSDFMDMVHSVNSFYDGGETVTKAVSAVHAHVDDLRETEMSKADVRSVQVSAAVRRAELDGDKLMPTVSKRRK
jgi:hypothetical protein